MGVRLRRGVTFHDGEPFNADTVLFNLDRMFRRNLDKWGVKDVTAGTSFEKVYPFVTRWEKADDYTVRITRSEPAPTLWDFVGREPWCPGVRHQERRGGAQRAAGRHRAVEDGGVEAQDSMRFERYEGYWGTPRSSSGCASRPSPRRGASRRAAGGPGRPRRGGAAVRRAGVLGREPGIKVDAQRAEALLPDLSQRPPKDKFDSGGKDGLFTDPRVRLALNLAVNKEAHRQEDLQRLCPGQRLSRGIRLVRLRRAGALRLRSHAGPRPPRRGGLEGRRAGRRAKKGGETLTLQLLFPAKHYGQGFDEMTPAVAEMLKDVGVQVVIKPVDFGTLLQTVTKGTLPLNGGFAACRTSNNLDADDYLRDWTAIALINWAPYPAELLTLYRATRREVDPQKRLKLLADLQRQRPRLGAGGVAVPGGQDLRAQRARAPRSRRCPSCTWTSAACAVQEMIRARCAPFCSGGCFTRVFVSGAWSPPSSSSFASPATRPRSS